MLARLADSVAYAYGLLNGGSFKKSLNRLPGDTLDYSQVLAGFRSGVEERGALIDAEQARQIFQNYIKSIQEREATKTKEKNDSILLVNKHRPGVVETSSGLQYRVLSSGTGIKPLEHDTVVVHYSGRLINGKQFDSSYERKEPLTLSLDQVILGWREGLTLMNIGSKYEFYIPSKLAYGDRSMGDVIPANSTLIFEIELLEVRPYKKPVAPSTITEEAQEKSRPVEKPNIGKANRKNKRNK